MRTRTDLNFDWLYSESFNEDMLKKNYDDSSFDKVDIPHTNKELPLNYFDEKIYQFVSCYRKHLKLPAEAYEKNKRTLLHFEGAASYARVFVNGKEAGSHKGAYTPFVFDITDLISKGENIISVKLDSTERPEIPPFGFMVDYLVYGGIYREVWLECVDVDRIEDVFVRTPGTENDKKEMLIDIELSKKAKENIQLQIIDEDGKTVAERTALFDGRKMRFFWQVPGVKNWELDSPNLYFLKVKCFDDEKTVRFGFRTTVFKKDGFYINGKKVKLMGLNRHQSYPYVGYAMPRSAQRADADLLKFKLGCNIVRTSHYPDSTHFIERCDEIGLLVFTEMPSWQHLGVGEWRENCKNDIRTMILRDRNHPSVILWGVRVNEGADCDEFYLETNALARSLDDSRQTGGVRNFPRSHLFEDVYTYNDFSHSGSFISLLPAALVAGRAPYLVTENNGHMYPTKSFDREQIRTEHALRHARVQNASFGSKRISGCIDWCMADYNTHKDFGSGDRICYHGVTDMFRIPKLAAYVFASQQDKTPVMEHSSTMDIGEHPGGITGLTYIFTNCDYVRVYKNDKYVSTVFPKDGKLKNLPYPPISPKDFIGDSLVKEEGIDPNTAYTLKKVLMAANEHGFVMPPIHYVRLIYAMIKGKLSVAKIYDLVTKYQANWGQEQLTYRFDGYKNGSLVKTITRTNVKQTHIEATADSAELKEDTTYDVTRIELVAKDQNGNRLPFCGECVEVSVKGPAKGIGPDKFSLVGGARAFWIRTIGKSGKVEVTVKTQNLGTKKIELNAVKV